MTFLGFFFSVAPHLLIKTKLFVFIKFYLFSRSDRLWGGQKNVNSRLKIIAVGRINEFFKIFVLLHIYPSREFFLFLSKFHIFSRSEKSWGGGQTKHQFSAKNDSADRKNYFFRNSFLLHIHQLRRNFFVFSKIAYLQPLHQREQK